METFHLYKDIEARTNGEIYLGIVGPVRTGKSTFIKRFMDLLVLPNMTDANSRARTRDELPQSASGKTIMTTEPKFVPKEAAEIQLSTGCEGKSETDRLCRAICRGGNRVYWENDAGAAGGRHHV